MADVSSLRSGWKLEHSYARLPRTLFAPVAPTPVAAPRIVVLNEPLVTELGLSVSELEGERGAAMLAGNVLPPGAEPIAQAYAGHQYGHFTVLGDGRAILLGEQISPDGKRHDVQLKGAGPTPFSRRGDGRAALGPMLREYIIGEAMHALGIPTTRALAVTETGEKVWRETGLPGAVLTRIASSHIRVGTFEWAVRQHDERTLVALVDYSLERHFPGVVHEVPALALLEGVIERQAKLIAQWMLVGFVHGVMNTDNMAISGETIDYGPCAFLDRYDPATVFSSIDAHGRYAFGNQAPIAQWNLTRFAETLLALLHPEQERAVELATQCLEKFGTHFHDALLAGFRKKLGLFNEEPEDAQLVDGLLQAMRAGNADFTNTFAALANPDGGVCELPENKGEDAAMRTWKATWEARLQRQSQTEKDSLALRRASNPAVIPRNHLVEAALKAAEEGDLSPLHRLVAVVRQPYAHGEHAAEFLRPGQGDEPYRTFCGT